MSVEVKDIDLKDIKVDAVHHPRSHSEQHVDQIVTSMLTFGAVVLMVVDESFNLLLGHARYRALKKQGIKTVKVVVVTGLSDAKKRALVLAENKISENGRWNRKALAHELTELREMLVLEGISLDVTGFAAVEVDQIVIDMEEKSSEPDDEISDEMASALHVTKRGDVWRLGDHVIACDDARDVDVVRRLVGQNRIAAAFLDMPYNRVGRDIGGRGETKHPDFAMASGELTESEFRQFMKDSLSSAAAIARNGAVFYCCMDWRSIAPLIDVLHDLGREVGGEMLNLAVWVKNNAGQGSFLRSQHELIAVFRVGDDAHLNNVQKGRFGRSRTNVWHYAGMSSFGAGRLDDLRNHPTPKPVALVIDAFRDCTRRDDYVLDTFCGSGTTLLAAERIGRRAVCMEIEPRYVDLSIRRWQAYSGKDAIHVESGQTFNELARHMTGDVVPMIRRPRTRKQTAHAAPVATALAAKRSRSK